MRLNLNQWHVKLYFWCLDVWDSFQENYTTRDRANLCQYIRTIFVWMPLTLAAHIGFVLFTFYVLLYYPGTHFGAVGTISGYFTVALIIGAFILYFKVEDKLKERRLKKEEQASADVVEKEEKAPGFIEIVWLYLVTTKKKFCPTIEFSKDAKEVV